jgi:hypothetical protein
MEKGNFDLYKNIKNLYKNIYINIKTNNIDNIKNINLFLLSLNRKINSIKNLKGGFLNKIKNIKGGILTDDEIEQKKSTIITQIQSLKQKNIEKYDFTTLTEKINGIHDKLESYIKSLKDMIINLKKIMAEKLGQNELSDLELINLETLQKNLAEFKIGIEEISQLKDEEMNKIFTTYCNEHFQNLEPEKQKHLKELAQQTL